MPSEDFLLGLLQACADCAPEPLYPAPYAREKNVDRAELDRGLDELRGRGLVQLTEWVKERGQGCALTEAGRLALRSKRLTRAPKAAPALHAEVVDETAAYGRGEVVRQALFEPRIAWATRILVAANVAYFFFGAIYAGQRGWDVGQYLAGDSPAVDQVLARLGALDAVHVFGREPERPEYERIILFCFLHIGLLHLAMNMYFLGSLGSRIEAMWGTIRYTVIYFCSGIVSGCTVLLANFIERESGLTAGASGCLFGIFAAMLVWFALNHQHLPENLLAAWGRGLGLNLILLVAINFLPGVSWQGHLGGAIGGLLTALLLHVQRFHPVRAYRILALLAVPLGPAVFFIAMLWRAGEL